MQLAKVWMLMLAIVGAASCGSPKPSPDTSTESDAKDTSVLSDGTDALGELADAADTNHPPTVTFVGEAASGRVDGLAGATMTFELEVVEPDGDPTTTKWSLTSVPSPQTDCSTLMGVESNSSLTMQFPLVPEDVRCADDVVIVAKVSDGLLSVEVSVEAHLVASQTLGVDWVAVPTNPVVPIGSWPSWDAIGHSDPSVGRLPSGEVALWFPAGGGEGGPVIGRAVAGADLVFSRLPDAPVVHSPVVGATPPVEVSEPWDYFRETPVVRWNATAGLWDMWYLAYTKSYFDDPGIGHMRSLDGEGTLWPQSGTVVHRPSGWDANFLTSPSIVQGPDGMWRLYYVGAAWTIDEGRGYVGLLTSMDGVTWGAVSHPVMGPRLGAWDDNLCDVTVDFIQGRYVMWYSGFHGEVFVVGQAIGIAVSEDGVVWERLQDGPVLSAGTPGSWNDWSLLDPDVMVEPDGSLLLTAYGRSHTPPDPSYPDLNPGRIGLWRSGP